MNYLDRLRTCEYPNRPQGPTDKTDKTVPAPGIGGSVSTPRGAHAQIEGNGPHPLWHIARPNGQTWVSYFAPPATLAQVLGWNPGAQAEPIPDPDPGGPLPPAIEARILAWLDALGEDCPRTRQEVLQRAQADPEALAHYLRLAATVAPSEAQQQPPKPPAKKP